MAFLKRINERDDHKFRLRKTQKEKKKNIRQSTKKENNK